MKAILIGSSGTSRELLRRLGEVWNVTVISNSAENLERLKTLREVAVVSGDGSSRVVLNKAGLNEAEGLVAATEDDEVNLEACRLAKAAGVQRVVAIAAHPENLARYSEIGVVAYSPSNLAARQVELKLETRRISSASFAEGKAEVIEFKIAGDSPVRGKALHELQPKQWIVGAVLRNDQLMIPHGSTVLQAGDLVTVIGAGADFSSIVRTFTDGNPRFPLDYGKNVAVALEKEDDLKHSFQEALYLTSNSRADSLIVLHRDQKNLRDEEASKRIEALIAQAKENAKNINILFRSTPRNPNKALPLLSTEESIGVLVIPADINTGWNSRRKIDKALELALKTEKPILIARGSIPYKKILVSAKQDHVGKLASQTAIDLARFGGAKLSALAVIDPIDSANANATDEVQQALSALQEAASIQGLNLEKIVKRGNPVLHFAKTAEEYDLVVLGIEKTPPSWFFTPTMNHIVRRIHQSVLIIPRST